MPKQKGLSHGVMEGGGAYNRHAEAQAGGIALALPHLETAIETISFDAGHEPIVVADYGSSQGKNSMAPVRIAIQALRKRLGPNRPICVVHVDQASNDFNTLFDVLQTDPDRYTVNEPNVFPSAIGRSFYEQVLPDNYVHLAWSSYAAVWLSHIPTLIPGHFFIPRSTGAVRAAFDRQSERDWETFLTLRAAELQPGGSMVIVLPGARPDGGLVTLADHVNAILEQMVCKAELSEEERKRMVLGSYMRSEGQLRAPFGLNGLLDCLALKTCVISDVEDAAWIDYKRNGDANRLAERHARFFRSTFLPSLMCALAPARDDAARQKFGDELENGLKQCIVSHPSAVNLMVQTLVVSKTQ